MRNNRMDNIKFFLIFCVVFGHMLELVDTGVWYKIIYSFHMPAFILFRDILHSLTGKNNRCACIPLYSISMSVLAF